MPLLPRGGNYWDYHIKDKECIFKGMRLFDNYVCVEAVRTYMEQFYGEEGKAWGAEEEVGSSAEAKMSNC